MGIDEISEALGEIRNEQRNVKKLLEASEEKNSRYRHSMREDVTEIKEGMAGMQEQIKTMGPLVKDSAERWQRHDGASTLRKAMVTGLAGVAGAVISGIGGYLYKLIPFAGVKLPGP